MEYTHPETRTAEHFSFQSLELRSVSLSWEWNDLASKIFPLSRRFLK